VTVGRKRNEHTVIRRNFGTLFVFLRPSGFMSNALFLAESIRREGRVRSCTGDGIIAFIYPDEIAEVAATVLTSDGYAGESPEITGPELLSYAEMTSSIGASIGRPLTCENITEDEEREKLKATGTPSWSIEYHLSIYRSIREGRVSVLTDGVERIIGRRPQHV